MRRCTRALCAAAFGIAIAGCSSATSDTSQPSAAGGSSSAAGALNAAGSSGAADVAGASGSASAGAPSAGSSGTGDVVSGGNAGAAGGDIATSGGGNGGAGNGGFGTGGSNAAAGAAAAGASGSAGAAGASAYSPCPATGACVVLPFGDSITYGYGSTDLGGYRSKLFALAVAGAKTLTFVGSSADGPTTVSGKPFPRQHEGHPGYTISGSQGIEQFVQQGIIKTFKPNIVLLAIGTNDISQNIDLANAPTRLGKLIDEIFVDAPAALIVLAKITPSQKEPANTETTAYDAALPDVVAQRVKQGKHMLLVDMNTPFLAHANWKTTLMTDSVHPNDAGYTILGQVWYTALASVLR